MKKDPYYIHENVKRLRLEQGFTQRKLCLESGLDYSSYRALETYKVVNPSVLFCFKLSKVFGVTVDELMMKHYEN